MRDSHTYVNSCKFPCVLFPHMIISSSKPFKTFNYYDGQMFHVIRVSRCEFWSTNSSNKFEINLIEAPIQYVVNWTFQLHKLIEKFPTWSWRWQQFHTRHMLSHQNTSDFESACTFWQSFERADATVWWKYKKLFVACLSSVCFRKIISAFIN